MEKLSIDEAGNIQSTDEQGLTHVLLFNDEIKHCANVARLFYYLGEKGYSYDEAIFVFYQAKNFKP